MGSAMRKILLGLLLAGLTAGCQSPMERAGYSGPINGTACKDEGASAVSKSTDRVSVPLICQNVTRQVGHSTYDNLHPRYVTSLQWTVDKERIEALGTTVGEYLGYDDVFGPSTTTSTTTTTTTTTTRPLADESNGSKCRYDYRTGHKAFEECLLNWADSQ